MPRLKGSADLLEETIMTAHLLTSPKRRESLLGDGQLAQLGATTTMSPDSRPSSLSPIVTQPALKALTSS